MAHRTDYTSHKIFILLMATVLVALLSTWLKFTLTPSSHISLSGRPCLRLGLKLYFLDTKDTKYETLQKLSYLVLFCWDRSRPVQC